MRGVTGGRAYDALILDCARKGKVQRLLTWNVAHFVPLGDDSIDIRRPGPRRERRF